MEAQHCEDIAGREFGKVGLTTHTIPLSLLGVMISS